MHRILIYAGIVIMLFGCREEYQKPLTLKEIKGETMGTYYNLKYLDMESKASDTIQQRKIDSILLKINDEVSTYIVDSDISQFNRNSSNYCFDSTSTHFLRNIEYSCRLYENTDGYFDPTVMPLVNYWGFGYSGREEVTSADSLVVDSLRSLMRMSTFCQKYNEPGNCIAKSVQYQLDFSALAKGYAVDILAAFLDNQDISNYYVEIGGEVKCRGKNDKKSLWTIGINTPSPEASLQDYISVIQLENTSMATSGNYRNFYESKGEYITHTVNPFTGYSTPSDMLSATIITEECAVADALATACMSMGSEKAEKLVNTMDDIEYLFVIRNEEGNAEIKQSANIDNLLKEK
jgi:thiamine biosynthesis lipoprotein